MYRFGMDSNLNGMTLKCVGILFEANRIPFFFVAVVAIYLNYESIDRTFFVRLLQLRAYADRH